MKTKKTSQITMTVQDTDEVILKIAGKGNITIDWGNETENEIHKLSSKLSDYTHIFTGTSIRNITITGGNITRLICEKQGVTNLDLTQATKLKVLYCGYNHITELDLSNNIALIHLFCSHNQLKSLDISRNTKILVCDCSNNHLINLDVSKNTRLDYFNCSTNQLSSLSIGNSLRVLFCENNCLTSFDVNKDISLLWLILNENKFSKDALNLLFRTLPIGKENIICIEKNPGIDECDLSIIESKGWEVVDYDITLTNSKNKAIRIIYDDYLS